MTAIWRWLVALVVLLGQAGIGLTDDPPDRKKSPVGPFLQVAPQIYCGGEPNGDLGFASLVRRGVKTLISVDGARPDVELARAHGLRYVHIPIGYEGVSEWASDSLTRVVRDLPGPYYIHCHHGRHRGPVAAAIFGMAAGKLNREQALDLLNRAGTDQDYVGLRESVKEFEAAKVDKKLPELREVVKVTNLAEEMAMLGRLFDQLDDQRRKNWATNQSSARRPHQLGLLVRESLRESRRNLDQHWAPLADDFAAAEGIASRLEQQLRDGDWDAANLSFLKLKRACNRCHSDHRDQPR